MSNCDLTYQDWLGELGDASGSLASVSDYVYQTKS